MRNAAAAKARVKAVATGFERLHNEVLPAGPQAGQVLREAVESAVTNVAALHGVDVKSLQELVSLAVKKAQERVRVLPAQQALATRSKLVATKAVLSSVEMTEALGISRQALHKAVRDSRMFTLEYRGENFYPAFFADPEQDRRKLEKVAAVLRHLPGWSKWQFFTTPKLPLDGATPLQALRKGRLLQVLKLAQAFAERETRRPAAAAGKLRRIAAGGRRFLARFRGRPLILANFTGKALRRHGATAEISTVADYTLPQQWAAAVHAHPDKVDGILYMSRQLNTGRAVAVFDRAAGQLQKPQYTELPKVRGIQRVINEFNVRWT